MNYKSYEEVQAMPQAEQVQYLLESINHARKNWMTRVGKMCLQHALMAFNYKSCRDNWMSKGETLDEQED